MLKNEIYYSLSKYEIKAIEHQIKTNRKTNYLDISITFKRNEIDKVYRLLSNLYSFENKEKIQSNIWETFLCNKILTELDNNELICFPHNLDDELRILNSFNIKNFLELTGQKSDINLINSIVEKQITKKVRIHYFQDETIIPIELQKVLNSILVTPLSFSNIFIKVINIYPITFLLKNAVFYALITLWEKLF